MGIGMEKSTPGVCRVQLRPSHVGICAPSSGDSTTKHGIPQVSRHNNNKRRKEKKKRRASSSSIYYLHLHRHRHRDA